MRGIATVLSAALFAGCAAESRRGPVRWVDPFIGTDGTGHAFPGPSRPWGMVQPGPDNRDCCWDYTSGYQYRDSVILGFSQTRANGTGIAELGDVLLQPFTGVDPDLGGTTYRKDREHAGPGRYSVALNNGVDVEVASTSRVAMYRFAAQSGSMGLVLDLQHGLRAFTDSLVLESGYTVHSPQRISGFARKANWVDRRYFFVVELSEPFAQLRLAERRPKSAADRLILNFDPRTTEVRVKVALSTVSEEGAAANLRAELPHWSLQKVVRDAQKEWNGYLQRVRIDAPSDVKKVWYTSMYRTMLQPSNIADVDGRFRGPDDQIHQSEHSSKTYYSTFSLWDTYRAAHPWYTVVVPERVPEFTYSLVRHSELFGHLPIWTLWGQENYCMIGNHAVPVLADAAHKGLLGVSESRVREAVLRTLNAPHRNSDWGLLGRHGYYPFDLVPDESVSRTLEHGVDDDAASRLFRLWGEVPESEFFARRAQNYRQLWDTATQLLRGRSSAGVWRTPFDSLTATSPLNNPGDYTEANAMQYLWTPAQYDHEGLVELLGDSAAMERKLDRFFAVPARNPQRYLGQEAMMGQYAHGNEPSHHVAYLYALVGRPDKTAERVAKICADFYRPRPDGLIGNDDCGQMSAWYLLSTLGFYPVNPSNATYVLGAMQVQRAVITRPEGRIRLRPHPEGIQVNGRLLQGPVVAHRQLFGQP